MDEQRQRFEAALLSQPFTSLGVELAAQRDIQQLTALINEGFQYQDADRGRSRVTESELQERIQEDPFYLIREDDEIIATVTTYPDTESILHVGLLVVAKQKRGQGIGSALLRAVELDAQTRGYSGMSLGYFAVASQLKEYYEHLGYQLTGETYDWENVAVVSMVKLFEPPKLGQAKI